MDSGLSGGHLVTRRRSDADAIPEQAMDAERARRAAKPGGLAIALVTYLAGRHLVPDQPRTGGKAIGELMRSPK